MVQAQCCISNWFTSMLLEYEASRSMRVELGEGSFWKRCDRDYVSVHTETAISRIDLCAVVRRLRGSIFVTNSNRTVSASLSYITVRSSSLGIGQVA